MRRSVPFLVAAGLAALSAVAGRRAPGRQTAAELTEIVRRSVTTDSRNWERARHYTYIERRLAKTVDSRGEVTSQKSETFEVMILYGQPYRKLIARNDQPLPPKEARAAQEKLDNLVAQRQRETPERRARRLAEYDQRRRKQREFVREVPDAFAFRLLGEERVSGQEAWKIEAIPKPGYKPRNAMAARIFPKVRGVIWIDQAEYQWVKLEAETIDTISFGGVVARLAQGARIHFEQTRVNDEVWLPVRAEVAASARLLLVRRMGGESEITFSGYRKFQSDSRVVSTTEIAAPEATARKPDRF